MRCFRDIAIALASAIVLLGLLEGGVRVSGLRFEGSFYQSDPVRYTAFRPNAAGWTLEGENFSRINSLGMRDRERTLAKPPATIRVAVFGDSSTAAQQVPLPDTTAQVLERILSKEMQPAGYQVEVLNFAVGGYSLAQIYLTMRETIGTFDVDIAMALLSPNSAPSASRRFFAINARAPFFVYRDGRLVEDPKNSPPPPVDPRSLQSGGMLKDLYNRISLLQLAMTAIQSGLPRELAKFRPGKPVLATAASDDSLTVFPFRSKLSPAASEAWRTAEGLLELMSGVAKAHGAEFWLVTHADERQSDPDDDARSRFMQRIGVDSLDYTDHRLERFATANGILFVATAPGMLSYASKHRVLLHGFFNTPRNHGHLNVTGNRVTAEILAREMLKRSPKLSGVPNLKESAQ